MLLSTCTVATCASYYTVASVTVFKPRVTCGLPLGCGHAVDMLHVLKSSSILSGVSGDRSRWVLASLTSVNMRVNALKTVVLCNGSVTNANFGKVGVPAKVWRTGQLSPVQITTRDLGVDKQWTRALGLPARVKTRIAIFSVGLYGAEVGGMSEQHVKEVRAAARGAIGKAPLQGLLTRGLISKRREVGILASALEAPPCVKLHGLLPAPKKQEVINHEPALVSRPGAHTVG
eukprot:6468361-Amphidinium_carterae.1